MAGTSTTFAGGEIPIVTVGVFGFRVIRYTAWCKTFAVRFYTVQGRESPVGNISGRRSRGVL